MAEILLKIKDNPDKTFYQDGDIVTVFNQRRIRSIYAQHICHVKLQPLNNDGLRSDKSITKKFYEFLYEYKYEKVSSTEVKQIDLLTLQETILPMNVDLWLQRRLKHARHKIFGTAGNEFWYDGSMNFSNTNLDLIWTMIETDTPERESNYTLAPIPSNNKKKLLALKINDFDETEALAMIESEVKETKGDGSTTNDTFEVVKKRKQRVDWRSLSLPETVGNIEDETKEIDIRETATELNKDTDIETKSLTVEKP